MAVSLVAVFALIRRDGEISFTGFVAVFVAMLVLYRCLLSSGSGSPRLAFLSAAPFCRTRCSSCCHSYALVSIAAGYPLKLAFDLAGVVLPIYGGIVRIGCFLGGCCYGSPWQHGVRYPEAIFRPVEGYRTFRPGPDPGTRVMPTQLAESAGLLLVGLGIFVALWNASLPRGMAMPIFLLSYSVLRFFVDFFRRSSVRPRIGAFSEAQVFSLVVAALSIVVLFGLASAART